MLRNAETGTHYGVTLSVKGGVVLKLRKYDKKLRKHVLFVSAKHKKGKK